MPAPAPAGTDVRYARVVVDVAPDHLDRPFDYRVPDGAAVAVGQQVRVSFSGRRRDGWVVDLAEQPETAAARVQPLLAVHPAVLFDEAGLRLFRWVAGRYAAPLASVLRHALPPRVAGVEREASRWPEATEATRALRPPCVGEHWRPYRASGLLKAVSGPAGEEGSSGAWWLRPLPGDDPAALVADLVARCLAGGRDALVLSPDPASALPAAALAQAPGAGADLRATDDAPARYRAFLRGRLGHARVAVGERGGVFAPLRELGLVVVEDEANPAWKEQRSPRHHAREVALARAHLSGAVCVLLGDLPSAQLWRHLQDGLVRRVEADRAEERRRTPRVEVVDRSDPRPGARRTRLSDAASRAISGAVRDGQAAVVLAVRGGEGAALACRSCGRRRECPVCAGSLKAPRNPGRVDSVNVTLTQSTHPGWVCAACGWAGPAFDCLACGADETSPLAAGAGRLAQELAKAHPDADVVRMEGFDAPGPQRLPAIGVMTRGSVVRRPDWLRGAPAAVVVLPDADALLNRPALDAAEDALRLWFAAARWSSHVVLQTAEPTHPAVQALVRWDPAGFWEREAERRAPLAFPPARSLIRLVAPPDAVQDVAGALRDGLPPGDEVLGPDPDGGLLVKSAHLRGTLDALAPMRHAWAKADRKVRVDVDPLVH